MNKPKKELGNIINNIPSKVAAQSKQGSTRSLIRAITSPIQAQAGAGATAQAGAAAQAGKEAQGRRTSDPTDINAAIASSASRRRPPQKREVRLAPAEAAKKDSGTRTQMLGSPTATAAPAAPAAAKESGVGEIRTRARTVTESHVLRNKQFITKFLNKG